MAGAVVLLVSVLVASGVVAPAAWAGTPTGEFARFAQCPRFRVGVNLCVYAETFGGEVSIGRRTVQIERPLVIQGGIVKNERTNAETFVGALNGATLSRVPQKVPGGLLGQPLYVSLELIPPADELIVSLADLENRQGAAFVLPARMHLEGSRLGGECYVGSITGPIVLHLTSGTTHPGPPNTPISGKVGRIGAKDDFELLEIVGNSLVDNTFSAPVATGCGGATLAPLVDPLVDRELGLPSADGHNTIIESNTVWAATTVGVIASEGK
ncbi:MAG TPA: hypothetical protein VNV42_09960 [Solirubrobacteraceae bacterium]|nr:hypothetical protein [Solirubrobacteraceae bacterium]